MKGGDGPFGDRKFCDWKQIEVVVGQMGIDWLTVDVEG